MLNPHILFLFLEIIHQLVFSPFIISNIFISVILFFHQLLSRFHYTFILLFIFVTLVVLLFRELFLLSCTLFQISLDLVKDAALFGQQS